MARLACFGSARSPTWLRYHHASDTKFTATPRDNNPPEKYRHGPIKTPTPSPLTCIGTLSAAAAVAAAPTSTPTSRTLTGIGGGDDPACNAPSPPPLPPRLPPPPVAAVVVVVGDDNSDDAGGDADDDDRRRRRREKKGVAKACHWVYKHGIEFRLVRGRVGLAAMRRSRKARHRREREVLAGQFRMVDVDVAEGNGAQGEEQRPAYWDLLERLNREGANTED